MKCVAALLALTLLLLGCETANNPVSTVEPVETSTGTLRGKVELNETVPFQVRLLKAGQLIMQTEANGGYVLRNIEAGEYTLHLSAPGYKETELNVTVIAGKTVLVDKVTLVELEEPVSHIRGLLRNAWTGIRLPQVLVKLTDDAGEQYETLTTNEGLFSFINLPALRTFILTIELDDYEQHEATIEPIPAKKTAKLYIKLTPLGKAEEVKPLEPGEGLSTFSDAPDFELPDGNAKLHTLTDYLQDGKKVVLVFYWGGA